MTKAREIEKILSRLDVRLNIPSYDLKYLKQEGSFVILSNQLRNGLASPALLKLCQNLNRPYYFLSDTSKTGIELLDKKKIVRKYRRFKNLKKSYFSEAKAPAPILVVTLDFSIFGSINIPKKHMLNNVFGFLQSLKIPVIPINTNWAAPSQEQKLHYNLRIGYPVKEDVMSTFSDEIRFKRFMVSKVFALGSALEVKHFFHDQEVNPNEMQAIGDEQPTEILREEISSLAYHNLITSRHNFDVFIAKATEIPNILREIGRQREFTFRKAGEGTGKRLDIDEYDLYYDHLFIWDNQKHKLVGGYRLGAGEEIFRKYGVEGFYIHSLFKIKPEFHKIMQQSLELGRSYIHPNYQRKPLPLFLLWKGILHFLLQNSQYLYLYGPVSISKNYSNVSKSLIVEFIKQNFFDHNIAKMLSPRKPFKFNARKFYQDSVLQGLNGEISNLDSFIADIEPDHFKIPVLLKQYIKQNAKFISFNVDPNFSDALDGFALLDIRDIPYSTIEKLKRD